MQPFSLNIWHFQDSLTRRLTWWSIFSILSGAWMAWGVPFAQPDPKFIQYWRGMGIQFLAWGGIDLLIALFGASGTQKRRAKLNPEELISTQPKERSHLARILWINTGLDVLYVAGGIALIVILGASDPFWRGSGWGILLQGGFLFFFDLFHALKLR